jgi:hypothetical protein
MRIRSVLCLVLASLAIPVAGAQTLKVSSNGWTVTADPQNGTILIEHIRLATLAADVRPGLRERGHIEPLTEWSAARSGDTRLYVTSKEPPTAWRFDLEENLLHMSCNRSAGVLTGRIPAARGRMTVRLLDPAGTPVDWVGTTEIRNSFGGAEVSHRSFLPARNPECMYFSLGQTSGLNFHSIYDRLTDDAVDFPLETWLSRNSGNRDILDVEMPVSGNALVRVIPRYYTSVLGTPTHVPYDDSYFQAAPSVWSSWTGYYAEITEADIVSNTEWLARNLGGYGFQYVQLDDGYDRGPNGEHWWIEHWDTAKFPHGPEWLTGFIKSKGLRAGLWLVPNAYAGAVQQHPEWYLRYRNGELVRDYKTPALDSSNPEVLQLLRKLFKILGDWGFEYYKFDGEHAIPKYAANIDTSRLYDAGTDPLTIYRKRLQLIRETVGPHTFIEGCPGGTPLDGVGFFNSYFTGDDVYNSWQGMYPFFSSINANAFLNHILVYVMPGEGIEVGLPVTVQEAMKRRSPSVVNVAKSRESPLRGFGTTLNQARTLVTYSSLTGVVYSLSSILPELPEERVKLLKATLPTLPIFPSDLFSRGYDMNWSKFKVTTTDQYIHNYPEILDLKVAGPSGEYDVAAFTNWSSRTVTRQILLGEKLGLPRDGRFGAFDFWREVLVPVGKTEAGEPAVTLDLEPHETRVLLIHRERGLPQYLACSRHITGAFGIAVGRDQDGRGLTGKSETVAGQPYTLWFLAPEGAALKAESGGRALKVEQTISGGVLKATFEGQPGGPVSWSAR